MTQMAGFDSMRAANLVAWAEAEIAAVTDCGRLEAELLLAACSGIGRAALLAHPDRSLSQDQVERLATAVARRRRGEPVAYILGHKEFYSLTLDVGPGVLVPRPETELLVDAALARIADGSRRVLDLGTGSGAIALAIKHADPNCHVTAVDVDTAALHLAAGNGRRLGLTVRWVESSWFSALAEDRFDLIVSNPPYVASADPHFETGLEHEPRIALDGGTDGLDAFRAILRDAAGHLAPGGSLLLEHGFDQRESILGLARESGFRLDTAIDDLAGLPRVLALQEAMP